MEPVILLVGYDDTARRALLAELNRYAGDYQVEAATDGDEALTRLGELRTAGAPIAMVLADLLMRPVDGVAVLSRVRSIVPTAKRVLLIDWGLQPDQVPEASGAESLGLVDSILTKPTGPRDEEFHGTITEDLGDWAWTAAPVVEAVKVVGDDVAGRVAEIRDLM